MGERTRIVGKEDEGGAARTVTPVATWGAKKTRAWAMAAAIKNKKTMAAGPQRGDGGTVGRAGAAAAAPNRLGPQQGRTPPRCGVAPVWGRARAAARHSGA